MGRPAGVPFHAGPDWTEVRVSLDEFHTPRDEVLGVFFGANTPRSYHFALDVVELR